MPSALRDCGKPTTTGRNLGATDAAKEQMAAILRAHPSGLRSDQVRSRLAGAGMPLDLSAVTAMLHAMQQQRLLRRLLPYRREALRAEERPNTILPLERANVEFCGLTIAEPWWPTEQRRAEINIPVGRISPELLANLARRGNGGRSSSAIQGR